MHDLPSTIASDVTGLGALPDAGYQSISIQAIRSISLRHLAANWQRLNSAAKLSHFDDFHPGDHAHDPQRMIVWQVKEGRDSRTFSPIYRGTHLIEALAHRVAIHLVSS